MQELRVNFTCELRVTIYCVSYELFLIARVTSQFLCTSYEFLFIARVISSLYHIFTRYYSVEIMMLLIMMLIWCWLWSFSVIPAFHFFGLLFIKSIIFSKNVLKKPHLVYTYNVRYFVCTFIRLGQFTAQLSFLSRPRYWFIWN